MLLSQLIAILWWLAVVWIRSLAVMKTWIDLEVHTITVGQNIANPYVLSGFVYVPWTSLLLAPLILFSLPIAALLQTCLLFGLLTAVVFKFGGNGRTVLIVLASFIAFDAVLESNIDWIVALALLVPRGFSLPLLLVKPQDAVGVVLTYTRATLVRAGVVALAVGGLSLLVWGDWPIRMLANIKVSTLDRSFNAAPIVLLPWPISVAIAITLGYMAWKHKDPALGILGGLFIVPYITLYSLLIPFAMLAIKAPRGALILNLALWVLFGGPFVLVLLHRT